MINLQDIHQERELGLVITKVGLVLFRIKLWLVFIRVKIRNKTIYDTGDYDWIFFLK